MAISSFTGFLRNGKPTTADYTRSLNSVLSGISRYTVEGRAEELSTFRESMLALASHIHEQANSTEVESTVTQALDLLRSYNERSLQFNNAYTSELKTVMRTMTDTITYLSESRTRSVHQLHVMERELEQAAQIDDIRLLRARLMTCLDVVREETVRLQTEETTRSQEVRQQLERVPKVQEPAARFGAMDTVTGLPSRRTAERTITDSLAQGSDYAIAVFVVKRLASINAKYGREVGDEVMLRVSNHFAQHLSSATSLYRWSGPALVALISAQPANAEEIRKSWMKASAVKQEINMEVSQRSVFVMVETTMSFQLATKSMSLSELFRSMDQFVADQSDGSTETH